MRTVAITAGPLVTASANNIALSQAGSANVALNLNGSTGGALDKARQIGITGNDTGVTWAITGMNWSGATISESLVGLGGATVTISVLDYLVVTSMVPSAATTGNITVGTTTVAGSQWLKLDEWANAQVGVQFSVTGTVNYTFFCSFDDPNDYAFPTDPALMDWDSSFSPSIGDTANATISLPTAPRWVKVVLNSGSGSVKATVSQYNVVNH